MSKFRHPEKQKNPINPIKKKPEWIRSKLTNSREFFLTKSVINQNNLVTAVSYTHLTLPTIRSV